MSSVEGVACEEGAAAQTTPSRSPGVEFEDGAVTSQSPYRSPGDEAEDGTSGAVASQSPYRSPGDEAEEGTSGSDEVQLNPIADRTSFGAKISFAPSVTTSAKPSRWEAVQAGVRAGAAGRRSEPASPAPVAEFSRRLGSGTLLSRSFVQNLDEIFHVSEAKSSVQREVLGGVVNYVVTMYIINVNPLYQTGVVGGEPTAQPFAPLVSATAIAAGLATLAMGAWGGAPLVVAPGMSSNAYFASLAAERGWLGGWRGVLALSFVSALAYATLVAAAARTRYLTRLATALPLSFLIGVALGILIMLAHLGLLPGSGIGLIGHDDGCHPRVDGAPRAELVVAALVVLIVLVGDAHAPARRDVVLVAAAAGGAALALVARALDGAPAFVFTADAGDVRDVAFELSFASWRGWTRSQALEAVWAATALFACKIFDVLCTVFAVVLVLLGFHEPPRSAPPSARGGDSAPGANAGVGATAALKMRDAIGAAHFRNAISASAKLYRILLVDAAVMVCAPFVGVSPTTIFIESTAGAACGARTGVASLVTGTLFLVSPLAPRAVALMPPEVSGALLLTTALQLAPLLRHIDFSSRAESVPAVLGALLVPLLFSIHTGAALAFIVHVALLIAEGGRSVLATSELCVLAPLVVASVVVLSEVYTEGIGRR